jgi:23S rRNA pseudouridine2605 synthase
VVLERLQKILAHAGVASRRAAEELIRKGRVSVNGRRVTELGAKADPRTDRVEVDGKRVVAEKPVYYLLNKPRETVTTVDDPEGRRTTADILQAVPERVFPVGRLDYNTSGALLVTNDGLLAQALLHPRKGVPKTYMVKIQGTLEIDDLNALRKGIDIGRGQTTGKAELVVLRQERGNTWLAITLTEGKNRQIHRMVEALGYRVLRLSRHSFAGLTVEGLRPGDYRPLTAAELAKIKREYPASYTAPAAAPAARKSSRDRKTRTDTEAIDRERPAQTEPMGDRKRTASPSAKTSRKHNASPKTHKKPVKRKRAGYRAPN